MTIASRQTVMMDAGVEDQEEIGILCRRDKASKGGRAEDAQILCGWVDFDPFKPQIHDLADLGGNIIAREVEGAEAQKAIAGFEFSGEPGVLIQLQGACLMRKGGKQHGLGDVAGVHVLEKMIDGSLGINCRRINVCVIGQ